MDLEDKEQFVYIAGEMNAATKMLIERVDPITVASNLQTLLDSILELVGEVSDANL